MRQDLWSTDALVFAVFGRNGCRLCHFVSLGNITALPKSFSKENDTEIFKIKTLLSCCFFRNYMGLLHS